MQFSWFFVTLEHTLLMQNGKVQLEGPDKAPVIVSYFLIYYFIKTLYLLLRMRKISVLSFFLLFMGCFFFSLKSLYAFQEQPAAMEKLGFFKQSLLIAPSFEEKSRNSKPIQTFVLHWALHTNKIKYRVKECTIKHEIIAGNQLSWKLLSQTTCVNHFFRERQKIVGFSSFCSNISVRLYVYMYIHTHIHMYMSFFNIYYSEVFLNNFNCKVW